MGSHDIWVCLSFQGTNGRGLKVLYEGSMDENGAAVLQREPGFLGWLTTGQQDLLNLRLREHLDNKFSQMTQTDDSGIWEIKKKISKSSMTKIYLGHLSIISFSCLTKALPSLAVPFNTLHRSLAR